MENSKVKGNLGTFSIRVKITGVIKGGVIRRVTNRKSKNKGPRSVRRMLSWAIPGNELLGLPPGKERSSTAEIHFEEDLQRKIRERERSNPVN